MSKKFNHKWAALPKLKQVNRQTGRKYETEDGLESYPSITTVLGKTKDQTPIKKWRKRVGEANANKISAMATRRGTSMHKLCEQYLLNEKIDDDNFDGNLLFLGIKPHLERLDNVRALESRLISRKLSVAGTVDCIAEYDGELAIIDFKTSSKPKKLEYIEDYLLQGAFYFTAYYELTGELAKKITILISVQDGTVQTFELKGKDIIEQVEKLKIRIKEYYYYESNMSE